MMPAERLALHGGTPVHTGAWPKWPQHGPRALALIGEVLAGERWTLSGSWTGAPALERVFAVEWARFCGTRYCTPVDHGSSALFAAIAALGIGEGDEVIVPGLTWVATATAVSRTGAVPILVDIDPETLCIDPRAADAAVTPRTRAIIAVHLYSAMAEMDALRAVAARHGLALIEDAAQAHGAEWDGCRAGSLGDVGAFSMQQGKPLTSGEGGAAVTSDEQLHRRLELIRSDGRLFRSAPPPHGHPELDEIGGIRGYNLCLSEVHAALLLDGLERLDEQNRIRAANAAHLTAALASSAALLPIRPYAKNIHRSYYHYAVRVVADAFAGRPVDAVCAALEAELGLWVHQPYRALDDHPLFAAFEHPSRFALPHAHHAVGHTILFHHRALLGDASSMNAIAEAFLKVERLAAML